MARSAAIGKPPVSEALRTGLIFGIVEALTPAIGWTAGVTVSRYVQTIDHWIAFILLSGVGIHMLYVAFQGSADTAPKGRSVAALIATAVGTSIDAMAVGASLAFLQVNIIVIAIAIGLATFAMSSGGMLVGRLIGNRLGKVAELVAGLVFCGLGTMILIEHMS
ncbi:manganese efflux pump MntP family protein [Manganibacter manganicus]|nr:manganese efflux pump MntP family protein [Pseudaminobacter manganicus]